jgi:hypothetical protein
MLFSLAFFLQLMHLACGSTCKNVGNCTTAAQSLNLTCIDINSWSEVNNEISPDKCKSPPNLINLVTSAPLLLSNELNISAFSHSNDLSDYLVNYNTISFMSLEGIEVYPWPFCSKCVKNSLAVSFSNIEFYVNNKAPGSYNCTPGLVPDDSATSVSFLSKYITLFAISNGNTYGHFSKTVCPYLFKNAHIDQGFYLYWQVDSFLFVSLFRFQTDDVTMNRTNIISINSNISTFSIANSINFKLDTGLVNPLVFEKLSYITCQGTIKSIQTGLFKYLYFTQPN